MIYYGKNGTKVVDFGSSEYTRCWTCRKACGGCSWSRDGTPIEGWTAEKNVIPCNGEFAETYHIIKCPLYECDRRYGLYDGKESEEIDDDNI